VEDETLKEYEQHEVYEHAGQVAAIKNERADNVAIKMEQTDTDDYSMFISTEYLETLQDDGGEGGDEETYLEEEEFAFVKQEKRSRNVGTKKHYKRFVERTFEERFKQLLIFTELCVDCVEIRTTRISYSAILM
jgi:hypothetical protein